MKKLVDFKYKSEVVITLILLVFFLVSLRNIHSINVAWIFIMGLVTTFLISFILKLLIVDGTYEFKDFFIGENNSYSLSRVQFFFWVLLIISSQVAIITILIRSDVLNYYNFILGENILWILAASFGTYLSVQGIANLKKQEDKLVIKNNRDLADLLKDGDHLDFTKFQMTLWTLIALGLYFFNSIEYFEKIDSQISNIEFRKTQVEAAQRGADEITAFQLEIDSAKNMLLFFSKYEKVDTFYFAKKSFLIQHKKLKDLVIELRNTNLNVKSLNYYKDSLTEINYLITSVKASWDSLIHYANQDASILENLHTDWKKISIGLIETQGNLEASLSKLFKEETESEESSSSIPDISVTFLVLMGLIQGTYIGKKLLPINSPGGETPQTPSSFPSLPPSPDMFIPETLEGKEKLETLKLQEAFASAKQHFWPLPDVTGIDIGMKRVGGEVISTQALRIHVKRKIKNESNIPTSDLIPKFIHGIPTDVIQSNFVSSATEPGEQVPGKIIQPGVSIGDTDRTGTLGLVVRHIPTNKVCIISNYHVLTNGAVILPGKKNGGDPATDIIGKIIDQVNDNGCDATLAEITSDDEVSTTIKGTHIQLKSARFALPLEKLKKSGSGTGVTEAIVESENGEYKIPGASVPIRGFLLRKIRPHLPISGPKDSGATWFNETTQEAIGLHVGKSEEDGFAIACHMPNVLELLNAKIETL